MLDNQSTVDIYANGKSQTKIHDAKQKLVLFCYAGKALVTKKGDLKEIGTVWYHPQGIANIQSLSNVQKKCRVTYDIILNQGIIVHKADGNTKIHDAKQKLV